MKIVIDGENYPFPENFTFREMSIAKRITGLTAGELYPALIREDTSVAFVFGMIALRRAGATVNEEDLFDWPINKIVLDLRDDDADESDDVDPPAETPDAGDDQRAGDQSDDATE